MMSDPTVSLTVVAIAGVSFGVAALAGGRALHAFEQKQHLKGWLWTGLFVALLVSGLAPLWAK